MIQYHGGIGYTWEHEAHFFYKRAKRLAGAAGTADEQRKRIAELTIG
jgi:alkylation response protein AidB-like acyl-CoA dehydrogenase